MNIKLLFLFLILLITISILFYYTLGSMNNSSYSTDNLNLNYPKNNTSMEKNSVENDNLDKTNVQLIL